ncbi:MAG: P-loop NTPase fold protein, partial [Gemmatimonadaceae bacterium]
MTDAPRDTHQYWLFQYRGGDPDNAEVEAPGLDKVINWKLTAHKTAISTGDTVFIWRAGTGAGLKGWGVIAGERFPSKGEGFDRIPVSIRVKLGDPVPRDRVRSAIPNLSIADGVQGSNFSISTLQAAGLAQLIRLYGFPAPTVGEDEQLGVIRRRLERDINDVQAIVKQLSPERAAAFGPRVESLLAALTSDTFDRNDITRRLEQLSAEASEAAAGDVADTKQSGFTQVFNQAVQRAAANVEDIKRMDDAPHATPPPPVDATPTPRPPDHWPWHALDRVGIKGEVNNLARYIAHEDMRRAQAIGIFGEWGSGKSFFMRSLRSQIGLTAWCSREALKRREALAPGTPLGPKEHTVYCSRIVQIDFNAWHYVESNLWASLAGHIFEELHRAMKREAENSPTQDLDPNALFNGLATYREAVAERGKRDAAVKELVDKRDQLVADMAAESSKITISLRRAADVVVQAAKTELTTLSNEEQARLTKLVGARNIDELADNATQLKAVADERTTLWKAVKVQSRTMTPRGYAITAALSAAGIWLLWLGASKVRVLLGGMWSSQEAAKVVSAIVAAIPGVTVAVGALARNGRRLLSLAGSVHQKVTDAQSRAQQVAARPVAEVEAEITAKRKEREEQDAVVRQKRKELADIEAKLAVANPGVRLRSFLEDRVRDKSYEQHLGLISMVRRDFQQVSDLMRDYWKTRASGRPYAEVDIVLDDGTVAKRKVPFVERIVLYVDDLDRCPPEKVVDVLQAVHLLLGFDLFVVVVAVDVRWVGRSLLKKYQDLLEDEEVIGEERAWGRASSDDYLEKIFQIPFRIVPLSNDAREDYVRATLEEPLIGAVPVDDRDIPPVDLSAKELKLYADEEKCINQLHDCLGRSPRRVNRFVNVYRLMRAGMSDGDVQAMINRKTYPHLLGLFALLTGATKLGPQ